ncbi:unnamed protein product [Staurois parvus]|uniref:Uncharacterized protein n=1 Tax=Staurois parvus TaxID=386267 RepID=A0ABN9GCU1_9NEOB|nr:unnamed protein product [Staurois parvus]
MLQRALLSAVSTGLLLISCDHCDQSVITCKVVSKMSLVTSLLTTCIICE